MYYNNPVKQLFWSEVKVACSGSHSNLLDCKSCITVFKFMSIGDGEHLQQSLMPSKPCTRKYVESVQRLILICLPVKTGFSASATHWKMYRRYLGHHITAKLEHLPGRNRPKGIMEKGEDNPFFTAAKQSQLSCLDL